MSYSIFNCVDAGTENCPCYLAVTGDCLTCSRLQGKDYCDCSWRGVCIYNEFIQGNRRINNPRTDFTARIVEKKSYMEDLVVYILDVGKGFAIKASHPGSYVFMRRQSSSRFYDLPISVMFADVEKGHIHVAVKVISTKTKTLLEEDREFILRGVYRNGIQNVAVLKQRDIPGKKVLMVVKGIGLAPGILAARALSHGNRVDFVVDTEKISTELTGDYLRRQEEPSGFVKYLSLNDPQDVETLKEILEKEQYAAAAVLASDYFVKTIGELIKETLPDCGVAVSNNFRICCGEGICGACTTTTESGETIRLCKCQLSEEEILEGGTTNV